MSDIEQRPTDTADGGDMARRTGDDPAGDASGGSVRGWS